MSNARPDLQRLREKLLTLVVEPELADPMGGPSTILEGRKCGEHDAYLNAIRLLDALAHDYGWAAPKTAAEALALIGVPPSPADTVEADREPQERVLEAQTFLYNLVDEMDVLEGGAATEEKAEQIRALADQAHNIGVELEQVMAAFPGLVAPNAMQAVTFALSLVMQEEHRAHQAVRDVLAQMPLDRPAYTKSMAYHSSTCGAIKTIRRLQQRLREECTCPLEAVVCVEPSICANCGGRVAMATAGVRS